MTPLERALRDQIRSGGAITVEAFMAACNAFYYATRDPLGARGDFTTAPEISQMFGELVGACLADCWTRAGKPDRALFIEFGPGRGTLASDSLRAMKSAGLDPEVHFVETSPVLRQAQARAVPEACWHDDPSTLPEGPLLVIANEFLDALPVRQFVGGIERKVIIAAGGLAFDRDGAIVETSPARDQAVADMARRIAAFGGAALIVDYGHSKIAPGDSLQAVKGHRFAPLLDSPGEQDLTAHVDFEKVAIAAREAGAGATGVIAQGEWLRRLGIDARAAALARAQPERSEEIQAAIKRLCDPGEMGELFKVIALHSPDWPAPAGFE
ncbi:MAG TPA: SAM-dependent methyltransferase [Sphingomicrobium sp.]|nr:SAM-dependent methyltransferase [Sphingomicrobium sp.]